LNCGEYAPLEIGKLREVIHEMRMQKFFSILLSAVFLVSTVGTAAAAVPDSMPSKLAAVEQAAYGTEQTGALMDRVNHLERDFEGAHPNDSVMTRVNSLYATMFDNTNGPSLLTQMNAIEYAITREVSMKSIQDRVTAMETTMQGKPSEGTYKARIDKLAGYAFGSNPIPLTQYSVPANTLVRIKLVTPVNAKKMKVGDAIEYQASEDVVENGLLLFAKGAPGFGKVTKVVQARNFGRDAEVDIDFQTLKAVDGTNVDMFLGPEAKKQMETMAMAAGASIAGMVVLGPIGIVAGAFVNGKNVDLPAGTELYIQTKAETPLYGLTVSTK
jgi:hypothetical protein